MTPPTRILIVGGGHVGLYTALRLQQRLHPGEAEVTLVDPKSYMTYQPLLAEAAAGAVDPRHVIVPLRRVLTGVQVVHGRLSGLDHPARTAAVTVPSAVAGLPPRELSLPYDVLVLAPGSIARILAVPGLAEHGIGFRSVEEAVSLRNHVLTQLDLAASTRDPALREAALTFVFVGGGYAGTGALAELEDMARYAVRHYEGLKPEDMHWVLVEAGKRILPETEPDVGLRTTEELRGRNIEVRLGTRLLSVADGVVELSDGSRLAARTLVWTAGVRANPVLRATRLPVDARGRLRCDASLRVLGTPGVWAAGDAAAVPDVTRPGECCAQNAQHAVRQARVLADNLLAEMRGQPVGEYRHELKGSLTSLGLHHGVAQLRGRALHGRTAWLLHRAVHLRRVPTWDRKARVLADWVLAGLLKREIVSMGALEQPRAVFESYVERELRDSDGG
ncbi:NAD(P)/FAD-dependent oxidoreductase [Streptacidiphilus sp. PB12-B1b]|uniref:NAD(P)/FAD-dependent oxidoreductase n=1 Tax=Streptacidiphilus sp. PB12-B1b TaxID=2705012 RepID=UPI00351A35B1|nr:NAD(P)/FAD-dependent oxidoreductase [Streptacidiphilus sp. PB12-B1b]